ncbi:general transcription factor IIF subunit 1, partial [Phasianus colchicus]|uniref:general transcription factor IIF subunit 1 n=1 Tax=Phasianus colchicus TaxID=9054 RepID=UPI00129D2CBA
MQQRRLRDHGDEEEEEKEKKARKGGELRIHDLEDDLELSSDGSDGSDPDGEKPPRSRSKPPPGQKRKRKRKKKGSDADEAFEDSDDGDFEGQEVDYMSDGSRSPGGGPGGAAG